MSTVEVINGETQISIVPEADDTVVVIASVDLTTAIESGEQGPPGLPGPPGAPSYIPGPAGKDGNTILYGPGDPDTSVGATGNFYINTTTHYLFGPKAGGVWPSGTSLVGPQGIPGNTIIYGASDPVAGTGVDGDSYINTTTHMLFGPKAGGAWPAGTSLIGPTGATGATGAQGPPGTPGAGAPATVPPLMDGTAAVGTSTLFARQDHIHPSDTARVAKSGDTMTGVLMISPPTGNALSGLNPIQTAQQALQGFYENSVQKWAVGKQTDNTFIVYAYPGSKYALTIDPNSGLATVAADPTAALGIATKQYVDARASGYSGLQCNGSMDVNQFRPVGSGVGGAGANTMIFDNWRLAASGLQQPVGAQIATNIGGFNYCFQVYPNPAVALASGDSVIIYTPVEGYRIARLAWGNAGAVPITIAFWVYSAYPGLYSGSVINGANNSRSYIFTYTINSANTWEYKTITIPGDTAGSWPTDNSRALQVNFQIAIAAGNAAIGAANFWATGSYTAVAGTTNALASGGNFFLTGFAIFPGNAAPTAAQLPFVMRTYDQEFLLCQRYFQFWSGLLGCGYNGTGTGLFWDYTFPQMRAVPGITVANAAYSNSATISLNAGYSNHFRVQVNVITGGFAYWYGDYSLNASL